MTMTLYALSNLLTPWLLESRILGTAAAGVDDGAYDRREIAAGRRLKHSQSSYAAVNGTVYTLQRLTRVTHINRALR